MSMSKLSKLVLIGTAVFYALLFFFNWLNPTVDTWIFHAFAQFIRTGKYVFPIPQLPYKHIHTQTAPLYSLLLAGLYYVPSADLVLHGLQISMILLSGFFVFKILRRAVGRSLAIIAGCIFTLLPGNVIFTSLLMSEAGAIFLFTLYLFLVHKYFESKNIIFLSLSVPVGFLAGLWRYSFAIFGAISLIWLLSSRPKNVRMYVFPLIGVFIISSWIVIQHNLTGIWGLSLDSGIRLHINIAMAEKVLPKDTAPSMIEIHKYISKDVDLTRPFYEIEPYLVPVIGYDYLRLNKLLGDIAIDDIREHPLNLVKVTAASFFQHHLGTPYSLNLAYFGSPTQPEFPPINCAGIETIKFCNPIISLPFAYPLWNAYVRLTFLFYTYVFPVLSFIVFFPSLVWVILRGNREFKFYAWFFVIGRLFVALATAPWSGSRYLLPFYQLMVIITVYSLSDIYRRFSKSKNEKHV